MGFLDTLIFGYRQIVDGSNALVLQRNQLKFVGAASVADDPVNARTVVTLTGNSSLGTDGNGNSVITGRVQNTSNPKAPTLEYQINTANATSSPTVVLTIPTVSNRAYSIRGMVDLYNGPVTDYAEWDVKAFVRNNAGTVTIITTTPVTAFAGPQGAAYTCTLTVSSTNIVVTVTDPVVGRRITGSIWVAERSF